MIEIRGLAKSYGEHQALKDVTLSIRPGEFVVVLHAQAPEAAGAGLDPAAQRLLPGMRVPAPRSVTTWYYRPDGDASRLAEGEAVILIRRTKSGGTKLKPEKGINLPDTALGLSPVKLLAVSW